MGFDCGTPSGRAMAEGVRLIVADVCDHAARAQVLVAVTGWGQAEDKRLASEAGFDRHLAKPVGPDALEPLVDLVRARRQRRRN